MLDTLVLSGGAYHGGVKMVGLIKKLLDDKLITMNTIKNVYGISAGALVASMFMTLVEPDEILDYVMNRPWGNLVDVTPDMMFGIYKNKGMFNKNIASEILRPLLGSKGLSCDITMKEFYEYNSITFKIYTFDLNSNTIVELSHNTYPDYKLIDCLYYSTSIPVVFEPSIVGEKCYIDPGCIINYPLKFAIADKINKDNMLCIKCTFEEKVESVVVDDETNLMDFTFQIFKRVLYDKMTYEKVDNEIYVEMELFSVITLIQTFRDKSLRMKYLDDGFNIGDKFINTHSHLHRSL